MKRFLIIAGLVMLMDPAAFAQQPSRPATPPAPAPSAPPAQTQPSQQPATQQQSVPSSPGAPQQFQASGDWARLPKMILERQFAGPLQDTVVQRLRDAVDGTICYLYLPISVQHSGPASNGFVEYGSRPVGTISCMLAPALAAAPAAVPRAPVRPSPPAGPAAAPAAR